MLPEEKENFNEVFCAKYNEPQKLEEGCKHPNDYCQYRQSCLIYFYEQENRKKKTKEENAHSSDQ